ncbi:MAG: site-2 protease family protein [Chloroflexi bacterium]|nr:site-2 protease family protein [Chloroflexota bacterium]
MLFFLSNISSLPGDVIVTLVVGLLLALLIGMTVHEFAHNYVGDLMGDPNPRRLGKLTLNPMAHIYWPGFLMFVIIGFGILGTAPIAAHRMRNSRYGYLAAVAAGPISNLMVAVVAAIIFRIIVALFDVQYPGIGFYLQTILDQIVLWNLLLFVFNFMPFFPLDGWFVVLALLPAREAIWWERNAQNSQFAFIILLLLGFMTPIDILGMFIGQPVYFLRGILIG